MGYFEPSNVISFPREGKGLILVSTREPVPFVQPQPLDVIEYLVHNEVWTEWFRKVSGYRNYYVTKCGKVFSDHSGVKQMIPQNNNTNHKLIRLSQDGVTKSYLLHRIIYETFKEEIPEGLVCCHNDGNPHNNHLNNLRADTQRGNELDKLLHGTRSTTCGVANGNARLTELEVIQMRLDFYSGGYSKAALGRKFGISGEQARDIVNRRRWRHVA